MTPAKSRPVPPHRRRSAAFPCKTARSACSLRHGSHTHRARSNQPSRLVALAFAFALAVGAPTLMSRPAEAAGPRSACLEAVRAAEAAYDLPDGLLVAIALAESGLHAHAMNIGGRSYYPETAAEARRLLASARSGQSVMAGCVQVNARVHARNSDWPLDPQRAANWAARYLRMHYDRVGNWADAIRRWNGGAPGTANMLVCRVQAKLEVVNPGSDLLGRTGCGQRTIARVRQSGVTLLEMAEAQD
jgi:hypothetical protein